MRSLLEYPAGCMFALLGRWGRPGGVLLSLAVGGGLALAALIFAGPATAAKAYSPYSDPEKPVLSTALAGDENVRAFQDRFDLTDGEVSQVLAAVREENDSLAGVYRESEKLLAANRGLSAASQRDEIAASDYDESVREAVAKTKAKVESVLPKGSRDELAGWVDARFAQEAEELSAQDMGPDTRAASTGKTCRVWATYYDGYTNYEVALPHQNIKFAGGYKVRITTRSGHRERAPVKEVGPWNFRDNYWARHKDRTMWRDLPRCTPEAQAAYFNNYNHGEDDSGREVLNPSGLDMTLPVAKRLGIADNIRRYGKVKVNVYYPWVRR